MVRPPPVQASPAGWLHKEHRHAMCVFHLCLLPRVSRLCPAEDLQDMGLSRDDGTSPAPRSIAHRQTTLRAEDGEHCRLALTDTWLDFTFSDMTLTH